MNRSRRFTTLFTLIALLALPSLAGCFEHEDLGGADAGGDDASPGVDAQADARTTSQAPQNDAGPTRAQADALAETTTPMTSDASDATPPVEAAVPRVDAGPGFTLTVTFQGFTQFSTTAAPGEPLPYELHTYIQDTTADDIASCGGGDYTGTDTFGPALPATPGLIVGHSYSYNYWIDSSGFTSCPGPVPPYYTVTFGPVTGDTSIVATPSDPGVNLPTSP